MTAGSFPPAPPPPSGRERTAGFMLVEMLVAMAVGAFLLVALASVTAFLLRVHGRTMEAAQENENAGRALAALSRDIERALPTRWAGKDAPFVFSGSPSSLLFARLVPGPGGLDWVQALRFETSLPGAYTRLVRLDGTLLPDAASPGALAWSPPVPVYAGPFRITFAYYMRLEGGEEALLDDWPAGDEMPVAVRVSFLTAAPGRQILSLRIPLLIDTELACALPDTPSCRGGDAPSDSGQGQ